MWQIFIHYLWLGCISFGGPAAHVGYFRRVFVDQKRWLDTQQFAANLALCQFLPGPASSQLGFMIALQRGGLAAAILAFIAFTLPSATLMAWLAISGGELLGMGIVSGLKLLALVVVADAIWSMGRQFCGQTPAKFIAVASAGLLLLQHSAFLQLGLILAAVLWGVSRARSHASGIEIPSLNRAGRCYLLAFITLLILSLFLASLGREVLFTRFYQAGSLVFGGGHVVLPLLQSILGDTIDSDRFLLGYAAAQAVPGPMFSFSAYLGPMLSDMPSIVSAVVAVCGIFLPGFLLLLALAPAWSQMTQQPAVMEIVAAVNAVAVGMLLAAWIDPVMLSVPRDPWSVVLALLGFVLLRTQRLPVLLLIAAFAGYGHWRLSY